MAGRLLADHLSSSFGANTENNPKEECKAVMTRSRLATMNEGDKGIGAEKQQLVTDPTIDPVVEPLSEYEEEMEVEDGQKKETTINLSEQEISKALIDLGANINLISLSMCRKLGELEIMPTRMTLQLADCSVTRPYGVIEDVLVRVKHLIFPTDFIVMDIEEDANIPVILGRPFMSIASCVVDIGKKKLEMSLENQQISFDLFNEGRELLDQDVCLQVKELDEKVLKERTKIDPG
ncbi:uncharacterized protein [Glycine max]|uniref:uncharacterized protein n=1 Tax=Glycine max TaxID=3847 RepID=UPI0003DEB0D9|nr:uncharacterized protein LOC102664815 [Glycine max]|eukprot:XP_006582613.1 uncharacterized protein LOC102664815 [Glycine max]